MLGGAGSVVLVFCVMPKIEVGTVQVKFFFHTPGRTKNRKTSPLCLLMLTMLLY